LSFREIFCAKFVTGLIRSNRKVADSNYAKKDLQKADFKGQNLAFANMRGADLQEADLSEANLKEADLREADLRGANLHKANMDGTFLRDANLRGADLSSATHLCCVDIESSYIDKDTKFPTYIRIRWKSERKYICKEIQKRSKSGRRHHDQRVKDKGRLWGNRRANDERRLEVDRRAIGVKGRKPNAAEKK
jgi:hypothetical protein